MAGSLVAVVLAAGASTRLGEPKQLLQIGREVRKQVGKDSILFPLLTGPAAIQTAKANALANLTRNLWSYMIIFCGHFPDGALHFTEEEIEEVPAAPLEPWPGSGVIPASGPVDHPRAD